MDEATEKLLNRKFELLFETAKRSLLAADRLLAEIVPELAGFEKDIDDRVDLGERVITPLLAAVALVDFAFRFHGVVQSLPFVRKDGPEMKRLDEAMKAVEEGRHHLQHMRGDLSKNDDIDYPLLGAFSWTTGMTAYTVSFNQPGTASIPTVAFDTHEKRWVSKHTFIVKHVYIDLDQTLVAMHSAFEWLVSQFSSGDNEFFKLKWGSTFAVAARMEFR